MKPLFTEDEFNNAKTVDKLPCECYICGNVFYKEKRAITSALKNARGHKGKYCSPTCMSKDKMKKETVKCINCDKEFLKFPNQIKKSPNHFCSHSCSTTYFNTHKTTGIRRSKLESWLELQLTLLYPNLEIHYNKKDSIGSELDIYIPSLKIAFELNGIFHYEPIFGSNKLEQIQSNDSRKYKACINSNISLCIIDSSQLKYFKEKNCKKFLDIITNIINDAINTSQ